MQHVADVHHEGVATGRHVDPRPVRVGHLQPTDLVLGQQRDAAEVAVRRRAVQVVRRVGRHGRVVHEPQPGRRRREGGPDHALGGRVGSCAWHECQLDGGHDAGSELAQGGVVTLDRVAEPGQIGPLVRPGEIRAGGDGST